MRLHHCLLLTFMSMRPPHVEGVDVLDCTAACRLQHISHFTLAAHMRPAEELDGGRPGGGEHASARPHAMGAPKDSAIELQLRGAQAAGDASAGSAAGDAAAAAGGASAEAGGSSMADASGGVCAAAETAAVFSDVPLLDSPAVVDAGRGGGAATDSAAARQEADRRGSSEHKVRHDIWH